MSSLRRNPYVAKAEVAEQKAADAPDDATRVRLLRDAAHQWERAAEREAPGKARNQYEQKAASARRRADGEPDPDEIDDGGAPPAGNGDGGRMLH